MAGTIFGLGLSQRITANGKPDAGWLLYLFEAASDIPVTAFKDTGLTTGQELPNPIAADANGMMPAFWLADGSYRVRATSADGSLTYFDLPSVLALGASSGSGGGGSSVDPNAIFKTGDVMWLDVAGTRDGWVRDNGRTIGSATSGATERANSDCQALFEYYWNTFSDTLCPVPGGRGASANADWIANKQITTRDRRSKGAFGLDDMGNSAAGIIAGGTPTVAGSGGGEELHTLTKAEAPSGLITMTDPGHLHTYSKASGNMSGTTFNASAVNANYDFATENTSSATTGITLTDHGADSAHNNMPPYDLGTWYRKL